MSEEVEDVEVQEVGDLDQIIGNLVIAMKPVWSLPADQQRVILETFINKTMATANALHDQGPQIERLK